MIPDDEQFFSRRLGFGPAPGETIGGSLRDWAVRQISSVPPLAFYGPNGADLRSQLPDFAEPVPGMEEGTRLHGVMFNKAHEFQVLAKNASEGEMNALEVRRRVEVEWPYVDYALWREALLRSLAAVNGPSPVFERFWAFWVNHFAVNPGVDNQTIYGPHTRMIRDHMVGTFAEMLHDAILQPAMIIYLDNGASSGPNSEFGRRFHETVNENLARELLELHTISPAGGYTQADVVEAALALTGWSYYAGYYHSPKRKVPYGVLFDPKGHEPGERTILGKKYADKNKGQDQAIELVADLAANPATAQFISWKLIRHFVADDPPEDSVARVRDAWVGSGGDMKTIHAAVIDEVIAKGRDHTKFTSPVVWLHQSHRIANLPLPLAAPHLGKYSIDQICAELGQGYNNPPQPNGFPDLESEWISKELLERRARYAVAACRAAPAALDHVMEFAVRLAGADSDLVANMRAGNDPVAAAAILLCSPQFLRI